ncbi:helix-turn-helix domain-containing protein [Georgenia yuyongxinii]
MLPPSEKWELFTSIVSGQFTQREAAAKWRVDRSTVTTICRSAKEGALAALSARPGRPGKTPEQVELEDARAELEQLRATITAQAVELHLYRGKSRWD